MRLLPYPSRLGLKYDVTAPRPSDIEWGRDRSRIQFLRRGLQVGDCALAAGNGQRFEEEVSQRTLLPASLLSSHQFAVWRQRVPMVVHGA